MHSSWPRGALWSLRFAIRRCLAPSWLTLASKLVCKPPLEASSLCKVPLSALPSSCTSTTTNPTDGVDITNPDTLTADLFEGVTQVVCSVGPVYGRTPEGGFSYMDGMSPARVDAEVGHFSGAYTPNIMLLLLFAGRAQPCDGGCCGAGWAAWCAHDSCDYVYR